MPTRIAEAGAEQEQGGRFGDDGLHTLASDQAVSRSPIDKGRPISDTVARRTTPIGATHLQLSSYGGTWRGDGLYVGSEANFADLLCFWNLRASGNDLFFLPADHAGRFRDSVKAHIADLDEAPSTHSNIEDWITIYYQGNDDTIRALAQSFQGKKRFIFSRCNVPHVELFI